MKKIITYIFFLSTMVKASPVVNPSECFEGYPWSTNEVYLAREHAYNINKQLFYSIVDRCHVAYYRTSKDPDGEGTTDCEEPWLEVAYKLGMGWPEVVLSRDGGTYTNQVQLLMDITKTNVVTSWAYWTCHPQSGANVTQLTAIATGTMDTYKKMYEALDSVCTYYVPASIIHDVDFWISDKKSPNLPTYTSLGAVLYDAGYTSLVTDIEMTNGYIVSCTYNFSTNSLPNDGTLAYLQAKTNFSFYSADCLAACIAQLKYLSVHLVEGRAPPRISGDEAWINYWTVSGTDTDGGSRSINVGTASITNYGRHIGDRPIAYAYIAQSDDYTWDDNLTNYIGTNATSSWTGLSQIEPSVQGWGKHTDWPSTGWECSWSGDMTINASITNNFPADPDYWHFTFTYGGTSIADMETNHSLSTNQVFNLGGVSPLSWDDDWESRVKTITDTNEVPAETNITDVTTVTNYWTASAESAQDGEFGDFVWTNSAGEDIQDAVYCYVNTVKYDFTNNLEPTDYLKQGFIRVPWAYTNVDGSGTMVATNITGQTTNIVPAKTSIVWSAGILTNCDGDFSWVKTYAKNNVYAEAKIYDAVGEINYLYHKPSNIADPDITNVTCYLKYISFSNAYSLFSTTFMSIPVLATHYADWIASTTHEVPSDLAISAYGHNLNYLNKVQCNDDYADGFLHLRLTRDKESTATWYPYNDKEGADARYFWCVSDGWAVLAYEFPKRNTNLPMPKQ